MFGMEIYRIFSRRLVVAALLFCLLFEGLYGMFQVWDEVLVEDGRVYRYHMGQYREAILRDREIAEEFAGPLTEQTVRDIWQKYGSPCEDVVNSKEQEYAGEGRNYNCCNTLIAERFCDYEEGEDGVRGYSLEENLSESRYLRGDYWFGYAGGGWYWYTDDFLTVFVILCLVIILAVSPSFTEDYVRRTVNCILPSVDGRGRCWRTRVLAGGVFSTALYWLASALHFGQRLFFYGATGLRVSCGLTSVPMFWERDSEPVWKAILLYHLCCWLAVLALTVIVQCVSAVSRQSFLSLLCSLLLYIGPFAFMRIILNSLPLGWLNIQLCRIIYSLPFSYGGMMLNAPPDSQRFMTCCLAAVTLLCGILGARAWCRHQA